MNLISLLLLELLYLETSRSLYCYKLLGLPYQRGRLCPRPGTQTRGAGAGVAVQPQRASGGCRDTRSGTVSGTQKGYFTTPCALAGVILLYKIGLSQSHLVLRYFLELRYYITGAWGHLEPRGQSSGAQQMKG